MKNLDQQIREALEAASNVRELHQPHSVMEDITSTFSGQYKRLAIAAGAKLAFAMVLAVVSIILFFQQDTLSQQLLWATVTILCAISIAAIYIFFWISFNKHITNREIKKLELQIALLIHRLDNQPDDQAS